MIHSDPNFDFSDQYNLKWILLEIGLVKRRSPRKAGLLLASNFPTYCAQPGGRFFAHATLRPSCIRKSKLNVVKSSQRIDWSKGNQFFQKFKKGPSWLPEHRKGQNVASSQPHSGSVYHQTPKADTTQFWNSNRGFCTVWSTRCFQKILFLSHTSQPKPRCAPLIHALTCLKSVTMAFRRSWRPARPVTLWCLPARDLERRMSLLRGKACPATSVCNDSGKKQF